VDNERENAMHRLMLLRHAKAVPAEGRADIERPLSERGQANAQSIGEFMAAHSLETGLALVSPAVRTRQTFDIVDVSLKVSPKIRVEPAIYEASTDTLLKLVQSVGAKQQSVLLVGHNPGFEDLANELVLSGSEPALSQFQRRMPTGALAVIDFDVGSWRRIKRQSGHLSIFITPANL
jgi:phosphohistidine phosphatase